ncbi:MAG: endonuclease [Planctomycetes bacterium]|nr:endonuclease [Planctomycetota bacterium]
MLMRVHFTKARITIVTILVLASTAVTVADPPEGYYDTVDATDSTTLRFSLHAVIDDHQRFPYTSGSTDTWNILELADEDPADAGRILDVYKNASYPKFGGGNDLYNREHTWPNSYGFPDDNTQNSAYTDCHMLFLCDSSYNSSRSNHPYRTCSAACSEKTTLVNNGQGGGSGAYPGNSNWRTGSNSTGTWETWIGRRGDVARALFYADLRYEGGTHGETDVTRTPRDRSASKRSSSSFISSVTFTSYSILAAPATKAATTSKSRSLRTAPTCIRFGTAA